MRMEVISTIALPVPSCYRSRHSQLTLSRQQIVGLIHARGCSGARWPAPCLQIHGRIGAASDCWRSTGSNEFCPPYIRHQFSGPCRRQMPHHYDERCFSKHPSRFQSFHGPPYGRSGGFSAMVDVCNAAFRQGGNDRDTGCGFGQRPLCLSF